MDALLKTAADIWGAADQDGQLRLIGGLAVRAIAGGGSRLTAEIDLALPEFLRLLEREGR